MTALGDFDVQGVLGQGGSGVVYDARWGPRRVALKVPHAALLDTPRARAQFIAEAQRLQSIGHPSVVKVLAAGELPDGRPFLAMERLDGEPLATTIARGPLALALALALFDELCGAVAALHAQGLVHRDLKPENVFVVGGRHAVLLDFGIAKDLAAPASTTTQEGLVRGTPAYMAPERFFGQPASPATDIYELAVTLYAMIAGRLPWRDVADPEARLSPRVLESVPRALDIEIRRALSTRAQNRPGTPAAFLAAVRTAATGDGEPSPADTAPMRPDDATAAPLPVAPPPDPNATPLGWAPTAPAATARPRRRGWPLVGTGMAAAAVIGFVAVSHAVRATDEPAIDGVAVQPPRVVDAGRALVVATPPKSSAVPDPWSGDQPPAPPPRREPIPPFAVVTPATAPAVARGRARSAVARLSGDARIVATVQLAELRGNPTFAALLHDLGGDTRAALLAAITPACVVEAMSSATWIVVAAPSLAGASNAAAVVEGRWQRADVARCLADDHDVAPAAGGYKLADGAKLAFLDDHSFIVSTRDDPEGPLGALAHGERSNKLVARLAPDAALAFAIDGTDQQWPDDLLPAGTSATGALYLDGGMRFAVSLTLPDADAAARLAHDARAHVGDHVDVLRTGNTVTIRGALGATLLRRATAALK